MRNITIILAQGNHSFIPAEVEVNDFGPLRTPCRKMSILIEVD